MIFVSEVDPNAPAQSTTAAGSQKTDAKALAAPKSEDSKNKDSSMQNSQTNTAGGNSKSDQKTDDKKSDQKTGENKSDQKTDDNKATKTGPDSSKSTDSKKNDDDDSKKTTSVSINPNLPAGGISMQTPATTISTYVKLGGVATFQWTYTSLIVTPSALNVEAHWASSGTYTIAKNHSAKETKLLWDTSDASANQTVDFITSKYTLYIYDAASNLSAQIHAGYLSPFQYLFGMYSPQPYTPWSRDASYINLAVLSTPIPKMIAGLFTIAIASALAVIFF